MPLLSSINLNAKAEPNASPSGLMCTVIKLEELRNSKWVVHVEVKEFDKEKDGYTSVKHQREVGTSYFDAVSNTISSGKSSTTAMEGSTESEQF